jgi:DNA primase
MRIAEYVKQHVTMRDVAAHYGLKINAMNKCILHDDSTASLSIRDKGYFKCFGCGAKGDLFAFVQKMENLPTFLETAAWLIETFNIPPPQKLIRQQLREKIRKEPDLDKAKALQAELLKIRKSSSTHGPGL